MSTSGVFTSVVDGRVDGSIYTDPAIFEEEMKRIFHRYWVYVGHASEVPELGDYVLKTIGRQPVILTRDEEDNVTVLLNQCRHRGSTVCQAARGNSTVFRCQYHGWTYKNSGELIGIPRPDGYPADLDKRQFGLFKAPRIGTVRGFVFASLAGDGISFDDHIAPARHYIEAFCDASPVGEVMLSGGVQRTVFNANWKYIGGDGYHGAFTHRSTKELLDAREPVTAHAATRTSKAEAGSTASTFLDRKTSNAVSLGNGHVRLHDDRKNEASLTAIARDTHLSPADAKEYLGLMKAAYGEDSYEDVLAQSDPHIEIWPNLQLTGTHVRTVRPVAPNRTEVEMAPALLRGVPESVNNARIRSHEWFFGPASFGSPDDSEIFERIQRGLDAKAVPPLLLARGLHRQEVMPDGVILGNRSDETTQRGQLTQWEKVMNEGVSK